MLGQLNKERLISIGSLFPPFHLKFLSLLFCCRKKTLLLLSCSAEYTSVVDMSFKAAVDALIDEMRVQSGGSLISGMPLAKLVPRVVQMSPSLLAEPSNNRIIQVIRTIPEVELFFTLLYANMSDS